MKKKQLQIIIVGVLVGLGVLTATYWGKYQGVDNKLPRIQNVTREFTLTELSQYDGTDAAKPIYLAMNGLVYDVTSGKKFYEKGGSYNWLAGKDSSKDLNAIGGDIIKRKYPVIGKLVQ